MNNVGYNQETASTYIIEAIKVQIIVACATAAAAADIRDDCCPIAACSRCRPSVACSNWFSADQSVINGTIVTQAWQE